MKLIETHFHLDYLKAFDQDTILAKARKVGVEKFITIAVEPKNLNTAKEIAEAHEDVFFTQGIHPHDSRLLTDDAFQVVSQNLNHKKCVAVGEIGLDYHYDNSPRDIQKKVFEKHLQLSVDKGLPVVIHTRDADEDTIRILKNFSGKVRGVIHSFTAGPELAQFAIDEGFFLGFNGIITFKKAEDARHIVEMTPVNQILLETDSPFLTPVPHRGKENGPYFLPHILEKVCLLKGIPLGDWEIFYKNSLNCFSKLL